MEEEKVSYRKIAIKTVLYMVVMATIIFTINSWSELTQLFSGETPPLSKWKVLKLNSIIPLLIFATYIYYRNWADQKEAIKKQKEVEAKHQSWIDNN